MGVALVTKYVPSYSQRRIRQCCISLLKALYAQYITNKTEHFSFKSGCVVQVVEHLKEDWLVALQFAVIIAADF